MNTPENFALSNLSISERNLPHWKAEKAIYWVTYRLADSIPKDKLDAWRHDYEIWLKSHPQPWDEATWEDYNERFGEPFEKWLDAGMGSCALAHPELREIARQCLMYGDTIRLDLEAHLLEAALSKAEIAARRKNPPKPPKRNIATWLARYQKVVQNASNGAVLE